ncbi:YybH family protein [Amycolatopsis thermoflava]|uniref:YybH family protein n=1 Tax=Amycolatopsis thermoflava TaxID=84480 RepID=UPI00364C4759
MTRRLAATFGPDSRNRLDAATAPGIEGALAALETFYFAFNQRDSDVFARVWTQDALAQLNNPLGGILRGGEAISALYDKVFHGPARVTVTFGDVVEYAGDGHALFAGRETGSYVVDGREVPLRIRTSRYFRYEDGRWAQFHHHGSIDDAAELAAYQAAIRG